MIKSIYIAAMLAALSLPASADIQQVLDKHCTACHQQGLAGAPKLDDKAAWAPRIAAGIDNMVATVIKGKGAMPMRGTCASCSDEQIRQAVEAMIAGVK